MSHLAEQVLPVAVLNPGGKDPEQTFPDFAGEPGTVGHPPINFHAWAACTRGSFHQSTEAAIQTGSPVVLLLRGRLVSALRALRAIKQCDPNRPVAVCIKETGTHQVTELLSRKGTLQRFQEIVRLADGCLCATSWMTELFRSLRPHADPATTLFLPTPYPIHDSRWDFSRPVSERTGILVGTREFTTGSRNHLLSLLALKRFKVPLSVMNTDGKAGRKLLQTLNFPREQLTIVEGKKSYPDYLRWMTGHRLVFQLDQSFVPGQVAGDALLCRTLCVGGNGVTDQLVFPELSSGLDDLESRLLLVEELLTDDEKYANHLSSIEKRARSVISFETVSPRLTKFFARIS